MVLSNRITHDCLASRRPALFMMGLSTTDEPHRFVPVVGKKVGGTEKHVMVGRTNSRSQTVNKGDDVEVDTVVDMVV